MDALEYKKKIETDALTIIEEKLKEGKIDTTRAKQIASFVIESLRPHLTIEQIYELVQKFDDNFPELAKVVVDASYAYDDKLREIVIKQVDPLIAQNKLDEADTILDNALDNKLKIEE